MPGSGTVAQRRRPPPFGGNTLVEGSAELLFPLPFIKDRSRLRSAFFFDIGNVFNTNCSRNQINCFDVDADELARIVIRECRRAAIDEALNGTAEARN